MPVINKARAKRHNSNPGRYSGPMIMRGAPEVEESPEVPETSVWILATGLWDDEGLWDDSALWQD